MLETKNKIESNILIKAQAFKKEIRRTEPHKHHNYFEIIYLSKGNGIHTIDYQTFDIKPHTLFFMHRDQVHHWNINSEPEGFVVIIKNGFIERCLDPELKRLFAKLSEKAVLYIEPSKSVELLFELLVLECNPNQNIHANFVESLLKSLISKILISIENIESTSNHVPRTIFQGFMELLSQSTNLRNNVSHYASQLNTTPQNLNNVCRKELSQSATQVLASHIINEARRQLIYTNSRISEIAFNLGFVDTSHFVKYFKKHTGFTPTSFRNQPF